MRNDTHDGAADLFVFFFSASLVKVDLDPVVLAVQQKWPLQFLDVLQLQTLEPLGKPLRYQVIQIANGLLVADLHLPAAV